MRVSSALPSRLLAASVFTLILQHLTKFSSLSLLACAVPSSLSNPRPSPPGQPHPPAPRWGRRAASFSPIRSFGEFWFSGSPGSRPGVLRPAGRMWGHVAVCRPGPLWPFGPIFSFCAHAGRFLGLVASFSGRAGRGLLALRLRFPQLIPGTQELRLHLKILSHATCAGTHY